MSLQQACSSDLNTCLAVREDSREQSAFVLRIFPSQQDQVPEALASSQLIMGWSFAEGLLSPELTWEAFREIVRQAYYANDSNLRRAGAAAGSLWRFIRDMKPGDLVVVPYGSDFFVAEVAGPPTYDANEQEDDTSYRRTVRWLNAGKPLPRRIARSALLSRMKSYCTCTNASDLLDEIKDCLRLSGQPQIPTFQQDLHDRLVREVLSEVRSGRIESFGFERLVQSVLLGLGAEEALIVPRHQDKGADILATFRIAGAFLQTVAVQAKHWQPDWPVGSEIVQQLIRGIEAESAHFGMVITSGAIAEEAMESARRYFDEKGIRIELVDGEQFAQLIVEHGLHKRNRSVLH